jgi:RimJ/RimL family protein N-acetyltransferase
MPPVAHPLWPLFDLRVRTANLELRLPTDDDVVALYRVASEGIHPPEEMPFGYAWTDLESPEFERGFARFYWGKRASWEPNDWVLPFAVSIEGEIVGVQDLNAQNFPTLKMVATGSWLGQRFQGRGIGKLMRQAVLAFAFDHLGAQVATSGAFFDNPPSSRVSEALGYERDGVSRLAPRGIARDLQRYRMTLEGWRSKPRPRVDVEGLDGCIDMFGLTRDGTKVDGGQAD